MIQINKIPYISRSEKFLIDIHDRNSFRDSSPTEMGFKEQSSEEFLMAILEKTSKNYFEINDIPYFQDGYWQYIDAEEFLRLLFPQNFMAFGNNEVFLGDSGKVYVTFLECLGWDSWGPVVQIFKNKQAYLTAVTGPYTELFLAHRR